MINNLILVFSLILFFYLKGYTQYHFKRNFNISVTQNNKPILNPWTGGFNSPLFSNQDFNGDKLSDLFVFDRSDETALVFLCNKISSDSIQYIYNHELSTIFNSISLNEWVLLRDFNCDGLKDIFTSTEDGSIKVFECTQINPLKFKLSYSELKSLFRFEENDSILTNLYTTKVDLPGITDIDEDGDLDILAFDVSGTLVEFNKNFSSERYQKCDSLVFELAARCWGRFREVYDFDNKRFDVQLNIDPCSKEYKASHAGGSICPIKLYSDSLFDLIISDNDTKENIVLVNGGNKNIAYMVEKVYSFPDQIKPAYIEFQPSFFEIDINQDSINDLLVSPYLKINARDLNNIWYYKAGKSNNQRTFKLVTENYLSNHSLDVGSNSIPICYDWNQDGLLDIILFSSSSFNIDSFPYPKANLLLNNGTNDNPIFNLQNNFEIENIFKELHLKLNNIQPAIADLNNDKLPDIIIGNQEGSLFWIELQKDSDQNITFQLKETSLNITKLNKYSSPTLFDFDEDQDLDLIVGYENGKIAYFENKGSINEARFELYTSEFGQIEFIDSTQFSNKIHPKIYKNSINQTTELWLGHTQKGLRVYQICPNPTQGFPLIYNDSTVLSQEKFNFTIFGDSIKNTKELFFCGTVRGGIESYILTPTSINEEIKCKPPKAKLLSLKFKTYPNPTQNELIIEGNAIEYLNDIKIYDMIGRNIKESKINSISFNKIKIDFNLAKGMYIFEFNFNGRRFYQKIIISDF